MQIGELGKERVKEELHNRVNLSLEERVTNFKHNSENLTDENRLKNKEVMTL